MGRIRTAARGGYAAAILAATTASKASLGARIDLERAYAAAKSASTGKSRVEKRRKKTRALPMSQMTNPTRHHAGSETSAAFIMRTHRGWWSVSGRMTSRSPPTAVARSGRVGARDSSPSSAEAMGLESSMIARRLVAGRRRGWTSRARRAQGPDRRATAAAVRCVDADGSTTRSLRARARPARGRASGRRTRARAPADIIARDAMVAVDGAVGSRRGVSSRRDVSATAWSMAIVAEIQSFGDWRDAFRLFPDGCG